MNNVDRRGFLRMLGLGAAAVAAPTKAYSFLGGILRPRPAWTINPHTREMLERQINPPLTIALQASRDMVNWSPYAGTIKYSITPTAKSAGLLDRLCIVTTEDVLDVNPSDKSLPRYLRIVHSGGTFRPGMTSFVVTPEAKI